MGDDSLARSFVALARVALLVLAASSSTTKNSAWGASGPDTSWLVAGTFVAYQTVAQAEEGTLFGTQNNTILSVSGDTVTLNRTTSTGPGQASSNVISVSKESTGGQAFFDISSQGGTPEAVTVNGNTYNTLRFSSQTAAGNLTWWAESTTRIVIQTEFTNPDASQTLTTTLLNTNVKLSSTTAPVPEFGNPGFAITITLLAVLATASFLARTRNNPY